MINVAPLNDEREHILSADCWCNPIVSWQDGETGQIYENGPIVSHNSQDCREVVERAIGEPVAPDKNWGVFT